MTKKFAQELKAKLKCGQCSRNSAPDRKFCVQHLEYARNQWHRHVTRCTAEGRCINCSKPKLPNEQRCGSCKAGNRASCKRWWNENKDRLRERYHDRLRRGLCGSCGLRKPVKDHVACIECHPKGYAR